MIFDSTVDAGETYHRALYRGVCGRWMRTRDAAARDLLRLIADPANAHAMTAIVVDLTEPTPADDAAVLDLGGQVERLKADLAAAARANALATQRADANEADAKRWRDQEAKTAADTAALAAKYSANKCNRHADCASADEKAKAAGRYSADHCHDDCCEDCFGT